MKAHSILGLVFLVAVVAFIGLSSQAGAQVDSDNDGFDDDVEVYLGTDPLDNCGLNAWPMDFNNDARANIADLLFMKAYMGLADTDPAWSPAAQRRDLNADGAVSVVSDVFRFYRTMLGATCNGGTPHPPEWPEGTPITMGIDPEITGNSANTLGDLEQCVRIDVDPGDFDDGIADHTIDVYVTGDTEDPTGYDAWVTYPPHRVEPISWNDLIKLPGAMSFTSQMPSRLNGGAAYLDLTTGISGDGTILRMNLDVKSAGYACFGFGLTKAYSSEDVIHPTVPRAASLAINMDCATGDSDADGVIDMCDNCPDDPNPGQEDFDGDGWGEACDNCPMTPTPWYVPLGDTDCDGFDDTVEGIVGTDAGDACADWNGTPGSCPGPGCDGDDVWPADLDVNTQINVLDILYFNPVLRGPYDARYDFNGDVAVNVLDILLYKPFMPGCSCTP